MLSSVLQALYFFLPAYVANTCACLFGGGSPVDMGRSFIDGRRILGDGVTIRGSLMGILSGVAAGVFMAYLEDLESPQFQGKILLGFLLSLGAIVGDAAGSFIKRRLGLKRGAHAPLLDQLNFVVGGLAFASLVASVSIKTVLILLVLTPIGHKMVNVTGYQLKLKDVPW
jgi:CDP-2,3-bis-(O-geranylgeranyl)-sn-glycerol synthase